MKVYYFSGNVTIDDVYISYFVITTSLENCWYILVNFFGVVSEEKCSISSQEIHYNSELYKFYLKKGEGYFDIDINKYPNAKSIMDFGFHAVNIRKHKINKILKDLNIHEDTCY